MQSANSARPTETSRSRFGENQVRLMDRTTNEGRDRGEAESKSNALVHRYRIRDSTSAHPERGGRSSKSSVSKARTQATEPVASPVSQITPSQGVGVISAVVVTSTLTEGAASVDMEVTASDG